MCGCMEEDMMAREAREAAEPGWSPAAPKKKELIFVPNRCGSLRASELLRSATRNMRCIEWDERIWSLLLIRSPTAEEKAMLPEDLNPLSRPVEEGEKIDYRAEG